MRSLSVAGGTVKRSGNLGTVAHPWKTRHGAHPVCYWKLLKHSCIVHCDIGDFWDSQGFN